MSKIITSSLKRWPGTVVLQDPILWPAYMALRNGIDQAAKAEDEDEKVRLTLPGMCACVEEWHLDGLGQLTPETFPASPRLSAFKLFTWILGAEIEVLTEAEEVPNA